MCCFFPLCNYPKLPFFLFPILNCITHLSALIVMGSLDNNGDDFSLHRNICWRSKMNTHVHIASFLCWMPEIVDVFIYYFSLFLITSWTDCSVSLKFVPITFPCRDIKQWFHFFPSNCLRGGNQHILKNCESAPANNSRGMLGKNPEMMPEPWYVWYGWSYQKEKAFALWTQPRVLSLIWTYIAWKVPLK